MRNRRRAIRRALEITTLALTLFMTSRAFAAQTVTVLYAGSLVGLMERSIGPAFKQQTGNEFRGHTGGSQELAKEVKEGALARRRLYQRRSESERASVRPHERGQGQMVRHVC